MKKVLLEWLKPDVGQIARHDPEKIRLLAQDMAANGLHQSVGAVDDGRIIFGHGRYLAAKLLGWKEIEARVYPKTLTESQFAIIRAAENIHREELTAWQKYELVSQLQRLNPAWKNTDLAMALSVRDSWITQILSVSRGIPAAQEAFQAGALSITDMYEIARRPEREQHELLNAKLSGANREMLRGKARRSRNGEKQEVRVNRIKIELPTITVTFAGKGISLDDAILAAPEAVKFMKKGQENGYTAKTISKMSAEKAAAGN